MITAEQLYEKLKPIKVGSPLCEFTLEHCRRFHPVIQRIEELKKEKNAIILAHNYVARTDNRGVKLHALPKSPLHVIHPLKSRKTQSPGATNGTRL